MRKPIASLSLDLDNEWSYMKTHGDLGWEEFPSYLDVVVPRILEFTERRNIQLTVCVVGQDAALEKNFDALSAIAASGHEIANHSFHHEPWLHLYSEEEIETELLVAEESIERATGQRCVGFRGPGFSISPAVLRALARRGYTYDASTFPTFLGPIAKAYFFMTARLDDEQREQRKELFGRFREGFRPLKPYAWELPEGQLLEIPVTTMPLVRTPFHMSYLLYLSRFSRHLAMAYFRTALTLCRLSGTEPSFLLHPLDFLGREDNTRLGFFPGMGMPREVKMRLVGDVIDLLARHYRIVTMVEHARLAGVGLSDRTRQEAVAAH